MGRGSETQLQVGEQIFFECSALRVNEIRRCLIGVGSITEVKQRRVQFIIGWVTAWDCQVPYTL